MSTVITCAATVLVCAAVGLTLGVVLGDRRRAELHRDNVRLAGLAREFGATDEDLGLLLSPSVRTDVPKVVADSIRYRGAS